MNPVFLLIVILLPIVGSLFIMLPFKSSRTRNIYTEILVCLTSALAWYLLLHRPSSSVELFQFSNSLHVSLQLDDAGAVFTAIIATLWPLAVLYSFEYMEHEEHIPSFFLFYTMTYGITLGIALSENLVTMYFFYEMLTLVTLPLVIHERSKEAIRAGRVYIYYSLGGAAFAFIGMIFILNYGNTLSFIPGGVMNSTLLEGQTNLMLLIYVMTFCGFSVKAAMFPFCAWLPKAGVAPTPVTALLHAVAVVKAGAFAVIRLTYYSIGTDFLRGTWAQTLVMCLTLITILYGSTRALKETHIKRRFAWSTVSNLSYILFGATVMTSAGLVGAFSHMIFHALMKICCFFVAGSIICKTGREYIFQLDGFAKKMPRLFAIFTVSACALIGVPGLCGFISKWYLAKAAFDTEKPLPIIGVGVLLISAILTAIYMLTIWMRAYFPGKNFDYNTISDVKDPSWVMLLPLTVFAVLMVVFGLNATPIINYLTNTFTMFG